MIRQTPEVLIDRIDKRMAELFITKKEMAEKLGMEYLTFWRKLRGKRGIDVTLLIKIAQMLGTTVSYLLGETDNPCEMPKKLQLRGTCETDGQGNIVCVWGNENRIALPDNKESRKILHDFFFALHVAGCVSADDIPSNILRIVPLHLSNAKSKEEIAHIVQEAINTAFPNSPVGVDVVIVDENMEDKKAVPVLSAYNGSHSSYTGNTLTVGTMA